MRYKIHYGLLFVIHYSDIVTVLGLQCLQIGEVGKKIKCT